MWRYCKKLHRPSALSEQDSNDAKLTKKLRNVFIRRYCKATYVEIPKEMAPGNYFAFLTRLETEIQSQAPQGMRAWEGIKFVIGSEPTELVDALLDEMPELKHAAERQYAIYLKHVHRRDAGA